MNPDLYHFDRNAADRACDFFELCLKHSKGEWAGKPFILAPWQRDEILRPLFGMKRADGTRQYRQVYVEVPRKNGKSETAAGVALYQLLADKELGAEVYSAAVDREQARIVFKLASSMVRMSPDLSRRCKVYRGAIEVPATGSIYRALSADVATKEGLNSHAVVFDELHAQKNRELWDVLTTSVGARRQPVIFAITTAGYDRKSIGWETHDYACKVRDGVIADPTFLPVIHAAPQDADWSDENVWAACNPNLGVSVKLEHLREECERAKSSPLKQNTFRRYYLNQWTEQDVRWLSLDKWDACGGPVDESELEGEWCYAGLDLSTKLDLSVFVLLFRREDGYYVLPFFWIPEERIEERYKRDRVPYPAWARDGWIRTTPGNVTDYDTIRRDINEIGKRFRIREIAFDPWNATQLANQLQGDGFATVEFGQGYKSMAAPTAELEKLIIGKQIRHGGHPVLRWNASNIAIEIDAAGNMKPSKRRSTERIDGIVALVMALGRMIVEPDVDSVYETRGLAVI